MMSNTFALAVLSVLCFNAALVSALSEGQSCTDALDSCDPPLSCVGNPTNKKCFMKKPLNMRCGQDPFWVCEDGLLCTAGVCKAERTVADSCNSPDDACIAPLSCVGLEGNKKCFMKKPLNMRCGQDPFWVCEDGLLCVAGVCKSGRAVSESCNSPDDACVAPLSCVGPPADKKCRMKKGLDMKCGQDPFWVCEDGLACVDGTCKRPAGKAGACSGPDAGCRPPFSCLGLPGNKKCLRKKFRGMPCNQDPFWVCADHLVCDDGVCKKRMGRRGKCNVNFQICTAPLSCEGTPELKRCVMKKGEGMVCGIDPFWVCQDGLECVDSVCTAP